MTRILMSLFKLPSSLTSVGFEVPSNNSSLLGPVTRFPAKSWRSQARSLAFRWLRLFSFVPLPFRFPFGPWWLLRNDVIGATLLDGTFENAERLFVEKFLKPGMTVLDISANQVFYTLPSSHKAGPRGKVFAFRPFPSREIRRSIRPYIGEKVLEIGAGTGNLP